MLISHYRQNADGQDRVRDVMGPVTSSMHSFVMPGVRKRQERELSKSYDYQLDCILQFDNIVHFVVSLFWFCIL